jgi:zinc transport system ATP-binding protein
MASGSTFWGRDRVSDMTTPALEVRNLFVSRATHNVIDDASFSISEGDYVGIVGPNGGGKTTLIMAVLGMLPREGGEVRLFGKSLEHFRDWYLVAYVSQDATSFDADFPLTVRELVALGRVNNSNVGKRLKEEDWKAVDEMLGAVDMLDMAEHRIGQLSGGQKQRMFVAKALVRKPRILFLDEPVTGVDAVTQERFYRILSDLNLKKGITIVTASHDLTAVFCRMSKVICVSGKVYTADVKDLREPGEFLKKAYGEHFHFVFHRHECEGVFDDGRPIAP